MTRPVLPTQPDLKLRGSERLMKQWGAERVIPEDLVRLVAEATKDLRIEDILIKGQPRPDVLRAQFVDTPDRCGTTVNALLAALLKTRAQGPVIRLFPRGIPVPDEILIDMQVGVPGGPR